jgi:SNF2 family DNA or RNA helicase
MLMRTRNNSRRPARYLGNLLDPKVVKAFLEQPRDNWLHLKELPRKQIEALVLPQFDDFHTNPWTHQLVCQAIGMAFPEFELLLDMGLGKSAVILNLIRYHMLNSDLTGVLILVPSAVNVETWSKQIHRHRPELRALQLLGTQEDRFKLLEEPADVYLMNYAGLMVYMTELEEKKKGNKTVHKMTPNRRLVENFLQRFNGVVFDEGHLLGGHTSLMYRLCRRLSNHCWFRYGMTGTPFGRDPTRLWSQFYLVDHGETLGDTLAVFRQAFFTPKANFWGGVEWTFDTKKEGRLHDIIQHRSIRYEDHECQDLPPLSAPERLSVTMTAEQKLYYQRVVQRVKEVRGDFRSLESVFIRMRQITAGFIGFKNEDDERLEVQFSQNPKIDALRELLECVPVGSKVVIYHEFLWSGRLICKALDELGIGYVRLSGLVKGAKPKIENYRRFLEDPKIQVLVANTISAGTGVDELQMVSRFVIFYELTTDPKAYRQAVKRIHRPGQQNRVYVYILEMEHSVDGKIWGFIEEGRDLFTAICSGATKELLEV